MGIATAATSATRFFYDFQLACNILFAFHAAAFTMDIVTKRIFNGITYAMPSYIIMSKQIVEICQHM